MFVRIKNLPSSKPYSRVKGFAFHPQFPLIAVSICDVKFYLRLHSYSLKAPINSDEIPEIFKVNPPLFQKTCEMTKKIFWGSSGSHLFQITTKGVKILALQSKSSLQKLDYYFRNSDYLEDNSEIICFAGTSKDTHLFYGTLDAKLVRYSLSRKYRAHKQLRSKPIAIQADPLDKWVSVLTIDNVLSIFSFSGLEHKKSITMGLDFSEKSSSSLTREEFQVHISPDAQTIIIPNMENTPIGTAFGVNTSTFDVSFMVGFSRAEITCLKYLPYVFQEIGEMSPVQEICESEERKRKLKPMTK